MNIVRAGSVETVHPLPSFVQNPCSSQDGLTTKLHDLEHSLSCNELQTQRGQHRADTISRSCIRFFTHILSYPQTPFYGTAMIEHACMTSDKSSQFPLDQLTDDDPTNLCPRKNGWALSSANPLTSISDACDLSPVPWVSDRGPA